MNRGAPPSLRDFLAKPESIRDHLQRRKRLWVWMQTIGLVLLPSPYLLLWFGYPLIPWPMLAGFVLGYIGGFAAERQLHLPIDDD